MSKDSKLVRIDVNHASRARITKVSTLRSGLKNTTAVLVGNCEDPVKGADQFIALVNKDKSVTAIYGMTYLATRLRGTATVPLSVRVADPAAMY